MNRTCETFWIAAALVLVAALAAVVVPIVAIAWFLAVALPEAVHMGRRQRYGGEFLSPATRRAPAGGNRVPPIIETTYTVVDRS